MSREQLKLATKVSLHIEIKYVTLMANVRCNFINYNYERIGVGFIIEKVDVFK